MPYKDCQSMYGSFFGALVRHKQPDSFDRAPNVLWHLALWVIVKEQSIRLTSRKRIVHDSVAANHRLECG
jgi:hypothetical protein